MQENFYPRFQLHLVISSEHRTVIFQFILAMYPLVGNTTRSYVLDEVARKSMNHEIAHFLYSDLNFLCRLIA